MAGQEHWCAWLRTVCMQRYRTGFVVLCLIFALLVEAAAQTVLSGHDDWQLTTIARLEVAPLGQDAGTDTVPGETAVDVGASRLAGSGMDLRFSADDVIIAARVSAIGTGTGTVDTGLAVAVPGARFGMVVPAGLAGFIYSPAISDVRLQSAEGFPLRLDTSLETGTVGAAVGHGAGVIALAEADEPDRMLWGGWFASENNALSGMVLASGMPAMEAGDGWYEGAKAGGDRLWGAAGARIDADWFRKAAATTMPVDIRSAAVIAATAGYPGADGVAGRTELSVALRRFRLDCMAVAATSGWVSPDGDDAPASTLRASVAVTGGNMRLTASAGREVPYVDSTEGNALPFIGWDARIEGVPRSSYGAAVSFTGTPGTFRLSSTLDARTDEPGTLGVDTAWVFAMMKWLRLETSWRASLTGSHAADSGSAPEPLVGPVTSERFDCTATARIGSASGGFIARYGHRWLTDGQYDKSSLTLWFGGKGGRLEASIKTDGWVSAGAVTGPWIDQLAYALKVTNFW